MEKIEPEQSMARNKWDIPMTLLSPKFIPLFFFSINIHVGKSLTYERFRNIEVKNRLK